MNYRDTELAIGQAYRRLTHIRKFNAAVKHPAKSQQKKLLAILKANADTAFGRRFNFNKINSVTEFQQAVPPSNYEDLQPYIDASMRGEAAQLTVEDPIMFATTSGTTGTPKFIPITPSHLRDYAHAFQVHNWGLIRDFPKAASGSFLIFASNDEEGVTQAGIPYGAVSGLLRRRQSQLVQKYFTLPHMIGRIKDVEIKYYCMLRLALCQNVTAVAGCNPSTFLLFADQMKERSADLISDIFDGSLRRRYAPPTEIREQMPELFRPDRERALELQAILDKQGSLEPKNVWPNLSLLSCWKGGPLSFYLDRLPEAYGDLPLRDFGYMASEGRGTIPLSSDGAGGVLALSCHFFEFMPEEEAGKAAPKFYTAEQLAVGKRYYIYFTTAAGLYRYNINDLIEVVGMHENTPVVQFVQKGGGVSSITGEKLTEEQVQIALSYAVRQLNLTSIDHFTFAVHLGEDTPNYECFVELKKEMPPAMAQEFLRVFEQSLKLQNIEYKDKRVSKRLGPPTLRIVPSGTFTRLRQQRVMEGAPEAQVKIPLLNSSSTFSQQMSMLASG